MSAASALDVALVDTGGANIGSVRYALERLGVRAELTSDPARIASASHVILPGVGAAAPAMRRLRELGLVGVLRGLSQPLLGICLGMQLMYESSDEGDVDCLGLLPGRVHKLAASSGVRVPHMGWNTLQFGRASELTDGIVAEAHAYFVHGYAAPAGGATVATCTYGTEFSAVVQSGNIHGAQFHPERSAAIGQRLLSNFLAIRT